MTTDRKALAWIGVFDGEPDPEFIWWDEAKARRWIARRPGVELAPLAIAPTLTDAEREAVGRAIDSLEGVEDLLPTAPITDPADTLRGLLERLA
jgi:hypothetical protein